MKNMMPRPGKSPVMETRSETLSVAKAMPIAGESARILQIGRLSFFSHAQTPSSKKWSQISDNVLSPLYFAMGTTVRHEADNVVAQGDANEREVGRERKDWVEGQYDCDHIVC